MICEKCGKPVGDGTLYCQFCGAQLVIDYEPVSSDTSSVWHKPSDLGGDDMSSPVGESDISQQPKVEQNSLSQNSFQQAAFNQGTSAGQQQFDQVNQAGQQQFGSGQGQFDQGIQLDQQQFGQGVQQQVIQQQVIQQQAVNGSMGQQAMQYNDTPIFGPVGGGFSKPPKKSKVGKILLISGIVAAVLAVGAFVAYHLIMTPKKQVMVAFVNTYSDDKLAESFALERTLGFYDITKDIIEKGGVINQEASFKIDDEKCEENFSLQKNNKKKLMSVELGISAEDELLTSKLCADADNTYLQIEGMDGYFAIKNKNIYSQLNNSPIYEEDGIEYDLDSDFSINWFSDEIIEFEDGRKYGISEESEKKLEDQFYDAMQVTKSGSQDVSIGGKNRKAKKYQVTIAEKDFADYVDSVKEVYMDEIFDVMYADYPDEWKDSLEESAEESFDEFKDGIEDDIQMEVYVYKNQVAGFILDLALDIDDEDIELHCEGYNEGAENLLTDFRYEFSATRDKDESVGFKLTKETSEKSGDIEENIEMVVFEEWDSEYYEDFALDINTEIESGSEFTFEIEYKDDWGDEDLFYISGDIVSVKKGESFEITIDKAEADGEELEKLDATIYMSNKASEADPEAVDPSEDVLFVLEADEDEIMDFIEDHVDGDKGALGNYLSRSWKADDLAAAESINTAISAALANEDAYDEYVEYVAPDASEYTYDEYDDYRIDIFAEAEPGEAFEAAPGLYDDDIETLLEEVNDCLGGKSPEIKYKGDSGYGKPVKWAIGIIENGKPAVYLATDDDYFAYSLQPYICDEYR